MDSDTAHRLHQLNHQFYQTFAQHFSTTRLRLQPGVRRIVEQLSRHANILDLGCGNGELWRDLVRRGHHGAYVGLDFSQTMLEIAAGLVKPPTKGLDKRAIDGPKIIFIQADLTKPDWYKEIPHKPFDTILAFAVLHHLPGHAQRLETLHQVRKLLCSGGRFIHSEWQFLNSPRLYARILPWETIGLYENQVDAGDYLLDWRHGGYGLRYVHNFSETELEDLAQESGFRVSQTFLSDGEGGKLGLYQIWEINDDKIVQLSIS